MCAQIMVQMIAIVILLAADPFGPAGYWMAGYGLIYIAALLSLVSMLQYFRGAWPYLSRQL